MKSANSLFGTEDKQAVEAAIAEAEKLTAGEIVTVVATISGRYDRAEDLFGLLLALIALSVAWILFQDTSIAPWSTIHTPVMGLPVVAGIVVGGFLVGAALATYFPVLRLPFIARAEMIEEVDRRALEAFQTQRLRNTSEGTGVLIYVSLYEHIVKVIGDDGVAAQLSGGSLDDICALVVDGLKQGRPADGLCQAVKMTGELLAPHLPPAVDDTNELANQLILLD